MLALVKAHFRHVLHRVYYQHIDHGVEIPARFLKDPQLFVGGGAAFEDRVYMFDLFARTEIVQHVVDNIEQFPDQVFNRNLFLLTEVQQLAVKAVPHRTPFVFLYKAAMIKPEPEILVNQYIELRDDRLEESRNRDSVIHPSRNIGDPEFKRRENVMGPDVPPDLRTVLDAVHFD